MPLVINIDFPHEPGEQGMPYVLDRESRGMPIPQSRGPTPIHPSGAGMGTSERRENFPRGGGALSFWALGRTRFLHPNPPVIRGQARAAADGSKPLGLTMVIEGSQMGQQIVAKRLPLARPAP